MKGKYPGINLGQASKAYSEDTMQLCMAQQSRRAGGRDCDHLPGVVGLTLLTSTHSLTVKSIKIPFVPRRRSWQINEN